MPMTPGTYRTAAQPAAPSPRYRQTLRADERFRRLNSRPVSQRHARPAASTRWRSWARPVGAVDDDLRGLVWHQLGRQRIDLVVT